MSHLHRRHTGEKPFGCLKCGRRYYRKENLLIHEMRDCSSALVSKENHPFTLSPTLTMKNPQCFYFYNSRRTPASFVLLHLTQKKRYDCILSPTQEKCPTRYSIHLTKSVTEYVTNLKWIWRMSSSHFAVFNMSWTIYVQEKLDSSYDEGARLPQTTCSKYLQSAAPSVSLFKLTLTQILGIYVLIVLLCF